MTEKLPFRYNGSNANMISEIMRFVPYESIITNFNEVFAGTAVLTLSKSRHPMETINDINNEIVNFFEQLRNNFEELIDLIDFTPYARAELEVAYEPCILPVERARRFYVRQMQARNGAQDKPYWKRQFKIEDENGRKMKPNAHSFASIHHLHRMSRRLKRVQIENIDAVKFINDYDHERALHYVDPPFMPVTRENKRELYTHEMTDNDHVELIETLIDAKGFIIVRHYACELYDGLARFHDFKRVDFDKRVDGSESKTESLYLSKNLVELLAQVQPLHAVKQRELF